LKGGTLTTRMIGDSFLPSRGQLLSRRGSGPDPVEQVLLGEPVWNALNDRLRLAVVLLIRH